MLRRFVNQPEIARISESVRIALFGNLTDAADWQAFLVSANGEFVAFPVQFCDDRSSFAVSRPDDRHIPSIAI